MINRAKTLDKAKSNAKLLDVNPGGILARILEVAFCHDKPGQILEKAKSNAKLLDVNPGGILVRILEVALYRHLGRNCDGDSKQGTWRES